MGRTVLKLFALVILLPTAVPAAIDGLHAVLTADRAHSIPALPVTFRVTVTNESNSTIQLPSSLALRVTPSNSRPFVAIGGHAENSLYVAMWPSVYEDDFFHLPPHSTRTFELPAQQNGFFADDRLTRPGKYLVELILSDQFRTNPNTALDMNAETQNTLLTNAITISVTRPTGEDAAVWHWMQEKAGKDTWGSLEWSTYGTDLEDEVFAHHSKSQYAPFLFFRRPPAQNHDRLHQLVIAHASGPFRDWIAYEQATSHLQTVRDELNKPPDRRDATRAIRAAEESERLFAGLRQATTDELIHFMLDANRDFMPTAADVRKAVAERQ